MISAGQDYTGGVRRYGAEPRRPQTKEERDEMLKKMREKLDERLKKKIGEFKKADPYFRTCPVLEKDDKGYYYKRFGELCRKAKDKLDKLLPYKPKPSIKSAIEREILSEISKEYFLTTVQSYYLSRYLMTFKTRSDVQKVLKELKAKPDDEALKRRYYGLYRAFMAKYTKALKAYIEKNFVMLDKKIYKIPANPKRIEGTKTTTDPDMQCFEGGNGTLEIYENCGCAIDGGGSECEWLQEDTFKRKTGEPAKGKIRARIYFNPSTKELRLIPAKESFAPPEGFQPANLGTLKWFLSRHKDKKDGGRKLLIDFLDLSVKGKTDVEISELIKKTIFRNEDGHYVVDIDMTSYLANFNMHLGKREGRPAVKTGITLTVDEARALIKLINSSPELKFNRHKSPIRIDNSYIQNRKEKDGVITYEYHFPADPLFLEKLEKFIESKYVKEEVLAVEKIGRPWWKFWAPTHKFVMRKTGKYISAIPGVQANTLKTLMERIGDWLINRKRGKESLQLQKDSAIRQVESIKHGKETAKKSLQYTLLSTGLFATMLLTSMFGPDRVRKFPRWIMYNVFGRLIPGIRPLIRWADRRKIINERMTNVCTVASGKDQGPVDINAFPKNLVDDFMGARKAGKSIAVHAYNGYGKTALKEAMSIHDPDTRMLEVQQGKVDATEESKYVSVIKREWLRTFEPFKGRIFGKEVGKSWLSRLLFGKPGNMTWFGRIIYGDKNVQGDRFVVEEASQFAGSGAARGQQGIGTAIKGLIASDMNPDPAKTVAMEMFLTTAEFEEARDADPAFWDRFVVINAGDHQRYGDVDLLKVLISKQDWIGRATSTYPEAITVTDGALVELRDLIVNKYPFQLTKTVISPTRTAVKNLEAIIRLVRESDFSDAPPEVQDAVRDRMVTKDVVDYYYSTQMRDAPPIMRTADGKMIPSPDYDKALPEDKILPEIMKIDPKASGVMVEFALRIDATRFGNDPQLVAEVARRLTKIAPADTREENLNRFIIDNIDRVAPLTHKQLKAAGLGLGESYMVLQIATSLNPADYNGSHRELLNTARVIAGIEDNDTRQMALEQELGISKKLIKNRVSIVKLVYHNFAPNSLEFHLGTTWIDPALCRAHGLDEIELIRKAAVYIREKHGEGEMTLQDVAMHIHDAVKKATKELDPRNKPGDGSNGGNPPAGGAAAGGDVAVAGHSEAAGETPGAQRRALEKAPVSRLASQGIERGQTEAVTTLPGGWHIDPRAGAVIALQTGEGARGPQAVSYHHMSPDAVGRMVEAQTRGYDRSSRLFIDGRLNPYALAGLRESLRRTVFSTYESLMRPIRGLRDALREDKVCRKRESIRGEHHMMLVPAR